MTSTELVALFCAENDEYLRFERVEKPFSNRPDVHAFVLLDRMIPGQRDMIAAAEHDEITLAVDPEQLAAVITPDEIITLRRCGVLYRRHIDALGMLV